jgi:hypothetical protein
MTDQPILDSPPSFTWTTWHDLSLALILTAIGIVGLLPLLLLLAAFVGFAGHGVTGLWYGLLVDGRNRMSLARLQMLLWILLMLSGFLAALFNIMLH